MAEENTVPTRLLAILNARGHQALADAIGELVRDRLIQHGWADSMGQISFTTYEDFLSLPPAGWPVAAILLNSDYQVEDYLSTGGEDDFWGWLNAIGLHLETRSAGVHEISVPDDAPLSLELHNRLATLQAFQWHAHLVAPDYTEIYRTVFEHFGRHPDHFNDLEWRGFEELCASVFKAQGYDTEVGKGRNDGGIDIRLTAHPVYGQQLTVVQVKRYRRKIKLELVQQVLGAAHGEGATRSIFITSSSFQPAAKRFARTQVSAIPLDLVDGQRIAEWCRGILPAPDWLRQQAASWSLDNAKIVVASTGVRIVNSAWAAVIAETSLAARLIPLNALYAPLPTDPMRGTETPDLSHPLPAADRSITARRLGDEYTGDDGRFYEIWDRKPRYFDYAD